MWADNLFLASQEWGFRPKSLSTGRTNVMKELTKEPIAQAKRLRQAISELNRYAENPRNSLDSREFSQLLEELDLARDEMTAAEELPNPQAP
jgi:hypothetical protein